MSKARKEPIVKGPNAFKQMKAKDFKGTLGKLIKYCKPYLLPLIISVLLTIGSAVLTILGPSKLSAISTKASYIYFNNLGYEQIGVYPDGTLYIPTSTLLSQIKEVGIVLIIFYSLSFVFSYLQSFIMTGINTKVTRKFRNDLSVKINNIPLSHFDRNSVGDTLSRVVNDVDIIGQSLNQSITSISSSVTLLIGILIAMFTTCWQMGLTAVASVPVSFIFIIIIAKISQKYFRSGQKSLGELNGLVEESYNGSIVVKSFNREKKSIEDFKKINDELYRSAIRGNFVSGLMIPINMFVGNIGYVAICIVGGMLFKDGTISIGILTGFIIYLNLFRSPIQQISQAMTYIQQMSASSERVFEFLELEEQEDESNKTAKIVDVKGEVSFENVQFSYFPDKPIIKDFSASVKPGAKVAIVGPTGAGKTTIVNLLMRFYEINGGSIKIDGIDTKSMKREDVRSLFSMVLQDTWIFNGTIRENIVYDKENVTDEELDKACKAANIKAYIDAQPNGYDTILSEKSSLSEGQRQLITIARAMIQNSPMLILDEATSNVDTRTEILIQEAMDNLTKGRTSFVIAHRLSTIKNADLILVLKDGNIIEQGNHNELLTQNGFYATLYNSQFEESLSE